MVQNFSVLFCTIRQHSSAPFVSSVRHHSLATILLHVIMLFYNSASTINLATDENTLCRLFNCITKSQFLRLLPSEHFIYVSTHLFYCRDSASLDQRQVDVRCPAAELLVNSVYCRQLIVALRSTPFNQCISALSCLHFPICQLSTISTSIYLWTLTIRFIFVCRCICYYSPLL